MAVKRPRGVGPVVARNATRCRSTRDPSSRDLRRRRMSSTRRHPTLHLSSGVAPPSSLAHTRCRPSLYPLSLARTRRCSTLYPSSLAHTRCRPSLYPLSLARTRRCSTLYPSSLVSFFNSRTRRRALRTCRRELSTRHRALPAVVARCRPVVGQCGPVVARCATRCRDPSRARPAPVRARPTPVRARPISTRAFHYSPALCQSIPTYTCHGDCLRDSLKGASYFSSHIIHHD